MGDVKSSLHEHEKKILLVLNGEMWENEVAEASGLGLDSIMHASLWLHSKGLVKLKETRTDFVELNEEGKEYVKHGLPERKALNLMKGALSVVELEKELGKAQAKIALTWLMKKKLVRIAKGQLVLTDEGKKAMKTELPEERALKALASKRKTNEVKKELEVLKGRGKLLNTTTKSSRTLHITAAGAGLVKSGLADDKQVNVLTSSMIRTGKWKDAKLRPYDIVAPVPTVYPGKRHFAKQAMEYVRKVWLEMGFKEMEGPLINPSFWNFDALFVPQEHSARDLQDTFYVTPEKGQLPSRALVEQVKKAHEAGTDGSTGWEYKWLEEEARKNVLRTHTTVLSARTIASLKKEELPVKYFSLGRCFRNETVNWSHLFEFNQVEGIVVDEGANFKHLLGYLKAFFKKLGFERARFRPAYFPYTEMSVEIDVEYEKGKWMELGGSGIFRPEVVEPLLGKAVPVLAWGPGFDRIILDYYRIKDLRELYKNDVKKMREARQWLM